MGETNRTTCTRRTSHARGMYPCGTIADPVRSVCDASAASWFDVPARPMRRRSNRTVSCACTVIPCLRSCVSVAHRSRPFRFARVRRRQMDELLRSCCKGMRARSRSPAHPCTGSNAPLVLPMAPRKGGHSIRPRSPRVAFPPPVPRNPVRTLVLGRFSASDWWRGSGWGGCGWAHAIAPWIPRRRSSTNCCGRARTTCTRAPRRHLSTSCDVTRLLRRDEEGTHETLPVGSETKRTWKDVPDLRAEIHDVDHVLSLKSHDRKLFWRKEHDREQKVGTGGL